MSIEIRGAQQLKALSKALYRAGQVDLRKDLNKSIRDAMDPVKNDVRASALANLPRRGGLAARVAASRMNVNRFGGGVRLRMVGGTSIRRMNNQGVVRHPVFARGDQTRDEWTWVTQGLRTSRGWFDQPTEDAAPEIRQAIEAAMIRTITKLERRV